MASEDGLQLFSVSQVTLQSGQMWISWSLPFVVIDGIHPLEIFSKVLGSINRVSRANRFRYKWRGSRVRDFQAVVNSTLVQGPQSWDDQIGMCQEIRPRFPLPLAISSEPQRL